MIKFAKNGQPKVAENSKKLSSQKFEEVQRDTKSFILF